MTRVALQLWAEVSEDGQRCAETCPAYDGPYSKESKCWADAPEGATGVCTDPHWVIPGTETDDDCYHYIFDGRRHAACIAAEQAAGRKS